MSALPSTLRPPIFVGQHTVLTSPGTPDMLELALKNQIIGELREAFTSGWLVHFSDGTPSQPVADVIMGAAIGSGLADEYRDAALLAAFNHTDDMAQRWEMYFLIALNLCARDLVDRMVDGQRISFGPKS